MYLKKIPSKMISKSTDPDLSSTTTRSSIPPCLDPSSMARSIVHCHGLRIASLIHILSQGRIVGGWVLGCGAGGVTLRATVPIRWSQSISWRYSSSPKATGYRPSS